MMTIQIIEKLAKEKTAWSKELQSFVDIQKSRSKKAKEVETVERFVEKEKAYLKELRTLLARHKKKKKLRVMEHISRLIEETEERIKTIK